MIYTINEKECSKQGLSLSEALILLAINNDPEVLYKIEDMESANFLIIDETGYHLTPVSKDRVEEILLSSDPQVPDKARCEALAIRLRSVFPKGNKDGYAWRGNTSEVTKKLEKFFSIFGNKWTDDEIVDAAERYVSNYQNDRTFMRLLKYFIIKKDPKEGEQISDLATYLENGEDTVIDNDDWLTELR